MSFLLAGFYIHYGKDICSKQLEKPVLLRFCGQTLRSRSRGQGTGGFHWSDIDPNYMDWSVDQYREGMKSPRAQQQFSNDIQALEWADTCVLILPCGRSAHTEVWWLAGKGKRTIVYIPEMQEAELMYILFDLVTDSLDEVISFLK